VPEAYRRDFAPTPICQLLIFEDNLGLWRERDFCRFVRYLILYIVHQALTSKDDLNHTLASVKYFPAETQFTPKHFIPDYNWCHRQNKISRTKRRQGYFWLNSSSLVNGYYNKKFSSNSF